MKKIAVHSQSETRVADIDIERSPSIRRTMKKHQKDPIPPDGGWAWFVCLGYSLILLSLRGLDPSFGLLFQDRLRELEVDSTGTSFVMSVFDANINFSGLFVGPLIRRFSYRKVSIFGSVLSCTGLILTSQVNSMTQLILTYSIMSGLGTGFAIAASFVALVCFFEKKRGQAVGFAMAGTTLAMMCLPQLIHILLRIYDFRGAVMIIGAWSLHSIVGSCLLQPVAKFTKKIPDNEEIERNALLDIIETSPAERRRKQSIQSTTSMMSVIETNCVIIADIAYSTENVDSKKNSNSEDDPSTWRRFVKKIVLFFDLDLLKDSVYLNIIVGLSFYYVAEVNFKLMTPFFLSSIGMTKKEVAFCLSLTAFTDIVARLILPTIFDKHGFQKRSLFWIGSFLVGIGRSILVEQSKGTFMMVTLVVIGFLRGATLVNMNLTISENCSLEKLPAAFGIFMVTKGIFIAAVGPLAGFVRDYSDSYTICIHAMTGIIMVTFVSWGIEYFWNTLRDKKHVVDDSPMK